MPFFTHVAFERLATIFCGIARTRLVNRSSAFLLLYLIKSSFVLWFLYFILCSVSTHVCVFGVPFCHVGCISLLRILHLSVTYFLLRSLQKPDGVLSKIKKIHLFVSHKSVLIPLSEMKKGLNLLASVVWVCYRYQ